MNKKGYVYLLTTVSHTAIYTGVTSDPYRRIAGHKGKADPRCFTARYNCTKLVYIAEYPTIAAAIAEEKRIKGGSRKQKLDLIQAFNPDWNDLWAQTDRYC